jgi:1,4-dihydroxy-2-naphthoate octaprenyltransferase
LAWSSDTGRCSDRIVENGTHNSIKTQRDGSIRLNIENRESIGKWWRLLRPHTLTASIMPVLIGTALAAGKGIVNATLFAAMLAASILIQSAVNMFNEYFDFKRGLDTKQSVGIGGGIVRGEVSEENVLRLARVFFLIAILLGVYICMKTNWWVAVVGSVSMLVGFLYSGGRSPISNSMLGELTSGIFMGAVIVVVSFYIQTGFVSANSMILSLPISILVASILLSNNIRDAEGDARKGRKTLAIRLGKSKATRLLGAMFVACFALVVLFVLLNQASPFVLISLASSPKAVESIRGFHEKETPREMMTPMKATSALHSQFGILFSGGILLGWIL